jgi:hypothetical protein
MCFPVRYELNFYILFSTHFVFKGLNVSVDKILFESGFYIFRIYLFVI